MNTSTYPHIFHQPLNIAFSKRPLYNHITTAPSCPPASSNPVMRGGKHQPSRQIKKRQRKGRKHLIHRLSHGRIRPPVNRLHSPCLPHSHPAILSFFFPFHHYMAFYSIPLSLILSLCAAFTAGVISFHSAGTQRAPANFREGWLKSLPYCCLLCSLVFADSHWRALCYRRRGVFIIRRARGWLLRRVRKRRGAWKVRDARGACVMLCVCRWDLLARWWWYLSAVLIWIFEAVMFCWIVK